MPISPSKPTSPNDPSAADQQEQQQQPSDALAQSFNADLRAVLMDLLPEAGARVTFMDIACNKHEAPTVLSARRQFLLAVELEKISGAVMAKLAAVSDTRRGAGIATLAAVAAKVLVDAELQQALRLAFEIIHPNAVARALSMGVVADQEPGDPQPADVFDLFPAEEVVRAVIPFCLAPIRGIVEMALAALTKLEESKQ